MTTTTARVVSVAPDGKMILHAEPLADSTLVAGAEVTVDIKRPRSAKQHRWYWAMLRAVVDATDRWRSAQELHTWIRWRLGLYEPIAVDGETVILEWQSIAFGAMDEARFRWLIENATTEIAMETGIDPDDLMETRT